MKKLTFLFMLASFCGYSQVGVGTTAPDATLDITATNPTGTSTTVDGILIPRVDRQRAQSMTGIITSTMIYVNSVATGTATGTTVNITANGFYYYDGSVWQKIAAGANTNWALAGNGSTTPGTNFIGTTDAVDVRIKTGGTDRWNISDANSGQLQSYSLGSAALPTYSFQGDTNTGIFSPVGGDILAVATNGTEKVRVEADGDVGVGVTPDVSAKLDLSATNRGFLAPRVALTAVNAAGPITTPATGLLVYNTATAGTSPNNVVPGYYYNSGTTAAPIWKRFTTGSGDGWQTTGNAGTTAANYVGTSDAVDFKISTAGTERARVLSGGQIIFNNTGAPATTDRFSVYNTTTSDYAINGYSTLTGTGVYGQNTGTGQGVYGASSGTGIATRGSNVGTGYGVYGSTAGTVGTGVFGIANVAAGVGTYGTSNGAGGNGVFANASGNTGLGLYAQATGVNGAGVYGYANATGGDGVYGEGTQAGRYGVWGVNNNATGIGVRGSSTGTTGTGVYGNSTGTAGFGVYGIQTQPARAGVYGINDNATGYGVYGTSAGTSGTGVYGTTTGNTGYGVYGTTAGTTSYGVYGASTGTSGVGVYGSETQAGRYGVYGINNNATGIGVAGNTSGTTGIGVYGNSGGATGFGLFGANTNATGTGIISAGNNNTATYMPAGSGGAFSGNPYGSVSWATNTAGGIGVSGIGNNEVLTTIGTTGAGGAFTGNKWALTGVSTITGAGNDGTDRGVLIGNYVSGGSTIDNVYVGARIGGVNYKILGTGGGSVSTTMKTSQGERILFAPEATENWFFDMGEVTLVNGKATVTLDPVFVETLSDSKPFKVFVQGGEDTMGSIRITRNQTGKSFIVEDMGGASNGVVQYSVYGIWKGKENLRMPELTEASKPKQYKAQQLQTTNPKLTVAENEKRPAIEKAADSLNKKEETSRPKNVRSAVKEIDEAELKVK